MKKLRLTNEDIGALCLALEKLIHAGIGTGDALILLAEDEKEGPFKNLLCAMADAADAGKGLAQIFREAGCFPAYACGLLEVGERVGKTEETLKALADYYDGRARMTRNLRSALLYPALLLLVLLAVVVILLVWVLPVFNDVYAQLGSSLTGLAGGLLAMGAALRKALPLLCALLGLLVIFCGLAALLPGLRAALARFWRRHRGDRGLYRKLDTARFAQALAMGLRSGMEAREAGALAAALAAGSPAFEKRCADFAARLDAGEALPAALRESGLLPRAESRLLEAGVRGGSGEIVMDQLAERLLEDSEQALEERVSRIEPAIVVLLCAMVGVILLSVMLPLMHIMTGIG